MRGLHIFLLGIRNISAQWPCTAIRLLLSMSHYKLLINTSSSPSDSRYGISTHEAIVYLNGHAVPHAD